MNSVNKPRLEIEEIVAWLLRRTDYSEWTFDVTVMDDKNKVTEISREESTLRLCSDPIDGLHYLDVESYCTTTGVTTGSVVINYLTAVEYSELENAMRTIIKGVSAIEATKVLNILESIDNE